MCPRLSSLHTSSPHMPVKHISPKAVTQERDDTLLAPGAVDRVGPGSLPQGWLESICPLTALPHHSRCPFTIRDNGFL